MPKPQEVTRAETGTVADDYFHELERLKNRDADRHDQYNEIDTALAGKLEDVQRSGIMQRTLRKLLPWYSDSDKDRPTVYVNLLPPIIEVKRSVLGVIPSHRVPYPNYDDGVVEHSDRIERGVSKLLHDGYWGRRCYENGEVQTTYGNSVVTLGVDLKRKTPIIDVQAPVHFYPMALDRDGLEFKRTYRVHHFWGYEADARWPNKGFDSVADQKVEVVEVHDEKYHMYLSEYIDSQHGGLVQGWTNPWPFVPVLMYRNRGKANSLWGTSDVLEAIELHREYNRRQALETEWILKTLYAPWVIKNPDKVPKRIPYGPGAVITVLDGGDVRPAAPANMGNYKWDAGKNEMMSLVKFVTDTQDQAFGQLDSAYVSGKGFSQSMGLANQRVEMRHQDHFPVHEVLYKRLLEMRRLGWRNVPLEVYGWKGEDSYAYRLDPEEFSGTFDIEVFLQSMAFYDVSQKIILGLQQLAAGVLSKTDYCEIIGWTEDAKRTLEQVRKEREQEVMDAIRIQRMQEQQMPYPNVDQVGQRAYRMSEGSINQMQPNEAVMGLPVGPEGIEGMEGLGIIEGEATELEGDLIAVADAVRAIDPQKVRGRVWLVGGILDGTLDEGDRIEAYFTDNLDKSTVFTAIKAAVPQYHGRMDPLEGEPPADEEALEVTPGTDNLGYDVDGETGFTLPEEGGVPPGPPGAASEDDQLRAMLEAKL